MTKEPKSASDTDKTVGERIKLARLMTGMSREKLAAQIGISWQQIQKYESGANRVSAGRLYQIAQILGRDIQWFFDDAECLPNGGDDPQALALARQISAIKTERRGPVIASIRGLIEAMEMVA